jgi:hypothetical protein
MGSELTVRKAQARGPVIISRELLGKSKLTLGEWVWAHHYAARGVGSLAALLLGVGITIFGPLVLGALIITASVVAAVVVCIQAVDASDNGIKPQLRVDAVRRTKQALGAPHAAERIGRARDVRYSVYVPYVYRDGSSILVAIKRMWNADARRSGDYGPVIKGANWPYFSHEETVRFDFDSATGSFGQYEGKRIRISEPTLGRVDAAYREVAEVAAALEQASYNEALREREIQRLALLYSHPEGPKKERERIAAEETKMDKGLADILRGRT